MSANSGGLAYQIALKTFGSGLREKSGPVTVSAVVPDAQQILINDPDRVYWLVMNRSPYHVEINFLDDWTYGQGILLSPNGGQCSMQANEDGEVTGYPMWVQSPVAGAVLFVMEIGHP